MTRKQAAIWRERIAGILLLVSLLVCGGCTRDGSTAGSQAATSPAVTEPAVTLVPAQADSPAAGICAEPAETVVTVTLMRDIPDPRCTIVRGDQQLQIMNATEQEVRVSLGGWRVTLAPQEAAALDAPLGERLAPGVHVVTTDLYFGGSGPELWLRP